MGNPSGFHSMIISNLSGLIPGLFFILTSFDSHISNAGGLPFSSFQDAKWGKNGLKLQFLPHFTEGPKMSLKWIEMKTNH